MEPESTARFRKNFFSRIRGLDNPGEKPFWYYFLKNRKKFFLKIKILLFGKNEKWKMKKKKKKVFSKWKKNYLLIEVGKTVLLLAENENEKWKRKKKEVFCKWPKNTKILYFPLLFRWKKAKNEKFSQKNILFSLFSADFPRWKNTFFALGRKWKMENGK